MLTYATYAAAAAPMQLQRPARLPPSMLAWCSKRLGGGKGDPRALLSPLGRQHTSKIQVALTGAAGEGLGGLGGLGGLEGLGRIGRTLSDPSPLPLNKEMSKRELKPAASAVHEAPLSSRTGAAYQLVR